MPYCPCCSDSLLHHLRGTESYWFCRSCWQEMPVLTKGYVAQAPKPVLVELATEIALSQHRLNPNHLSHSRSLESQLEANWERKTVAKVSVEV
jgi:hypothetical protein